MPAHAVKAWGIEIRPSKPDRRSVGRDHQLSYTFSFGKGRPGSRLLFTTPELQKFVAEHKWLQGKMLGYINYSVRPEEKVLELIGYGPFDFLDAKAFSFLRGKGIASRLERKAARHAMQSYPGFDYQEAPNVLIPRLAQLNTRKMFTSQRIPFRDFLRRMQITTRKWTAKKHRKVA